MDNWYLALAASAVLVTALCLAVPQAMAVWRARLALKLERKPKVVVPAATETAAAIMRFRRAVLHSDLADYFRPD